MSNNIFTDFILEKKVSEEIINKYVGNIPKQLIANSPGYVNKLWL